MVRSYEIFSKRGAVLARKNKKKLDVRGCKEYPWLLEDFWKKMADWGHYVLPSGGVRVRCFHKRRRRRDVIALMREYANISVTFGSRNNNPKLQRQKFTKASRHKKLWGRACICCGKSGSHRHHIIQLQHGGKNDKNNVVPICVKCHSDIHPWMRGDR